MNGSIVTIGLFDGVHLGHQAVISQIVAEARDSGLSSSVVTFDRHPADILRPGHGPLMLTVPATKEKLIKALGVDSVVIIPFTAAFAKLGADEFLSSFILPLAPFKVAVGEDFHFGKNREGDFETLSRFAEEHEFQVESIKLLFVNGEKASSSAIREHMMDGDIETARKILGRYLSFTGEVVTGEKRGRLLGFPTANINLPSYLCLPLDGVYAGYVKVDGVSHKAVLNVGLAPTFGGRKTSLMEAFLLDFSGDLYGRPATVEFHDRIRGEVKFDNPEDLARQIADDAQKALDMLE